MNSSPSVGRSCDQSAQSYSRKSCGSTTRADSFQSIVSARSTVATLTGCQLRFSTSVGRSRILATIFVFLRPSCRVQVARGYLSGVEPLPSGSQPDVQKPLHHRHHIERAGDRSPGPPQKQSRALSVEERQVTHRRRLVLGVHYDLVPAIELDRLVVGVSDPTAAKNCGIAALGDPSQVGRLRLLGNQLPVARLAQALRMLARNVHQLATRAHEELSQVRLTATTRDRL